MTKAKQSFEGYAIDIYDKNKDKVRFEMTEWLEWIRYKMERNYTIKMYIFCKKSSFLTHFNTF